MKCRICGTLLTMDAVKRVPCDCGEVDTRARAQQNEDLRLATEEFLKWRGWMTHKDHPLGQGHVEKLFAAYKKITGLDLPEYT